MMGTSRFPVLDDILRCFLSTACHTGRREKKEKNTKKTKPQTKFSIAKNAKIG